MAKVTVTYGARYPGSPVYIPHPIGAMLRPDSGPLVRNLISLDELNQSLRSGTTNSGAARNKLADLVNKQIIHIITDADDPTNVAAPDASSIQEATAVFHEPIVIPNAGTNSPGQQPDIGVVGSTLLAGFTLDVDKAYRTFKIPTSFVSDPSFHVHWTKEPGVSGDGDESGNTVRWKISYTVFPGDGADINVAPSEIEVEDTYEDSGTTERIVYRTSDQPAVGFVPGYYLGLCIEAITHAGTPMSAEPALVSVDLIFTQYINQ